MTVLAQADGYNYLILLDILRAPILLYRGHVVTHEFIDAFPFVVGDVACTGRRFSKTEKGGQV